MTAEINIEKRPDNSQKKKALTVASVFLVGTLGNIALSISLGIRTGEWQQFARGGVILIFGLTIITAIRQIRQGHIEAAGWRIAGGALFALLGTEFFMVGFGPILALLELVLAGGVAFLLLSKTKARRAFAFISISSALTIGLDFVPLNYRIPAPETLKQVLPIIAGLVVAAMVFAFFQQIGQSSIRVKLLFGVFIVLGTVVFLQTGVNLRVSRELSEKAEEDHLYFLYGEYNDYIEAETNASVALSLSYADRADIRELYLAKDRNALLNLLTPIFETLRDELNIRHLYIENPDGTVFVRIHNKEKYGDDITYRYTAAAALESKKTVAGVEVGPSRIGIRSVSPLWDTGDFIGMVEVGLDYDQSFVDDFKERTNADYNLWITYKAAETPGLLPDDDHTSPNKNIFHYASSSNNLISLPISSDVYDRVLETKTPEVQFVSIGNKELAVLVAPMLAYEGRVIGIVEILQFRTETLSIIDQSRRSVLIPATSLSLIGLLILGFIINQIVIRPVNVLATVAEAQIAGDLSARVNKFPPDEFGALGKTFNALSQQLDTTLKDQEKVIAERTKNIEEHTIYLESSATISRAIASITDTDKLIKQVVDLIKERFDLYYVGLFLADPKNEWAVLQAGTGEAGQTMLANEHRLKIGEGMIGWSVANAQARIALDVGEDAVRFDNPDLPDTRSEGALPLRSRGRVLGALTIQSSKAAAFTPEIITTLQTMADQIAIALDNAELLAKSELALTAERKAYGELSQQDWLALLQRKNIPGYISKTSEDVQTIEASLPSTEQLKNYQDKPVLDNNEMTAIIPIKIHGQVLGGVKLRKEKGQRAWTKKELGLAETLVQRPLAVALESARLFDQSQRRAAREHVIGNASAKMRESLNIEKVMQTAIKELHEALGSVETKVWLDASEADSEE